MPNQPPQPPGGTARPERSAGQVAAQIKADLAQRLGVAADQIEVASTGERTWPDQGLGCAARKGLYEPAPTPGYIVVLVYAGQRYEYHADRAGRFLRCDAPAKPLGPIR